MHLRHKDQQVNAITKIAVFMSITRAIPKCNV